MRASLSYEKLFVEKRDCGRFQTLADVRACILDSRILSISDCVTKRVVLGVSKWTQSKRPIAKCYKIHIFKTK